MYIFMQSEIFSSMCVYVNFSEEMVYITFISLSKKHAIQKKNFFFTTFIGICNKWKFLQSQVLHIPFLKFSM